MLRRFREVTCKVHKEFVKMHAGVAHSGSSFCTKFTRVLTGNPRICPLNGLSSFNTASVLPELSHTS